MEDEYINIKFKKTDIVKIKELIAYIDDAESNSYLGYCWDRIHNVESYTLDEISKLILEDDYINDNENKHIFAYSKILENYLI